MDTDERVEAIIGLRRAFDKTEPYDIDMKWVRWAIANRIETLTENVQSKGYWRRQADGLLFVAQEAARGQVDIQPSNDI